MKVNVANAPGADYDSDVPTGYDSWIDYWNKQRYSGHDKKVAGFCRNCGEKTTDLDGGHVEYCVQRNGQWYRDTKQVFITPLCTTCNNHENTKAFQVDEVDLIRVP